MAHPIPPAVDLKACLFGGQSFTWWRRGQGYEGIARGAHVTIDPGTRTWTASPSRGPAFLERYLGAHRTQPGALADDEALGPLAAALPGLRLLNQDPWEGFLAFMVSPVNNVPRIQASIARMCRALGESVGEGHGMPSPRAVADAGEEGLRSLGLGFRAPRIHAAAERIVGGELSLEALQDAPVDEAREQLMALEGIGPKVGECILCYALSFDDAFPVDRWVARASEHLWGQALTPEAARARWGQRAAMAQQLLFHGARTGLIAGIEPSQVAGFDRWEPLRSEGP